MAIEPNVDEAVRKRYINGAREPQESLCCPVSYDPRYLEVIPCEVIERDYRLNGHRDVRDATIELHAKEDILERISL